MKIKITENQEKKQGVYEHICGVLKQVNWTPEEKETDAHAFFSFIQGADNMFSIEASISGSDKSVTAMFTQLIEDETCPDLFKKSILIAAANILAGRSDQSGKVIGAAVGVYTEENYGHVECDCQRCVERKKNKLKNTNIN